MVMSKSRLTLCSLVMLIGSVSFALSVQKAGAVLRLPALFADHMVLQRGMKVPVWGWANPGEIITVAFAGDKVTATTDDTGKWMLELPAMKWSAIGRNMVITGDNKSHRVIHDVLVGEVWLCSGQSNMQYPLWGWTKGGHGRQEAAKANIPEIRLINVPYRLSARPLMNFTGTWQVCSPLTAGGFTAAGYYFARDIYRRIHIPIGLVSSYWGGTCIQPWTPEIAYKQTPKLHQDYQWILGIKANYERAKKMFINQIAAWVLQARAAEVAGKKIPDPPNEPRSAIAINNQVPTAIFNAMINPLIPYAMRGTIWYQGENNVGDHIYYVRLKAMIQSWRQMWDQGDFPFYIAQIAPYDYGNPPQREAWIWNAEENVVKSVPNTGIASTMDIGMLHNIHPFDKRDVGNRLALWALAKVYKKENIVYSGPMFKDITIHEGHAVIRFVHNGGGLVSRDGKALNWFQIANKGHKFVTATARIVGDTVVVSSPTVKHPVAVRFAWSDVADPNLMNKAGLPALPFATDQTIAGNGF